MESGHYKCNDANTSTSDWIRLNFDAIQTSAVQRLCGEDMDALERVDLVRPEEPDIDEPCEPDELHDDATEESVKLHASYTEKYNKELAEYKAANAKYEEELEEFESAEHNLCGWPVAWGEMYQCRDDKDSIQALMDSGFVVYRVVNDDLGLAEDILFGVDGGGYSFYEAHWIPLRVRFARQTLDQLGTYGFEEKDRIRQKQEFLDFVKVMYKEVGKETTGTEADRFLLEHTKDIVDDMKRMGL